jgi:hypothetical protein
MASDEDNSRHWAGRLRDANRTARGFEQAALAMQRTGKEWKGEEGKSVDMAATGSSTSTEMAEVGRED